MKRAARLLMLARELRGEADRWTDPAVRVPLMTGSSQLLYAVASAYSNRPDRIAEVDALAEAAINILVTRMTQRAERELAKGATP